MKKILVWFAFLLLLSCIANAATYYVSTDGDDGNLGTEAEPWNTVQHAINSVSADDTIYIKSGTYDMNGFTATIDFPLSIEGEDKNSTILTNGDKLTFSDSLTIRNIKFYRYLQPTIVLELTTNYTETIDGFVVENCIFDNVFRAIQTGRYNNGTIRNVRISNNEFVNINGSGIYIMFGLLSNINVSNNYFKNIIYPDKGTGAIVIGSNADRPTTRDIVISGNYMDTIIGGTEVIDGSGREVHGIMAYGTNLSITGNTILHLNPGQDHEAIYIKGQDSIIAYNVVEDCGSGSGGADISIKGGEASTRNKIIGNRIIGTHASRATLLNGDLIITDNYINKRTGTLSGLSIYAYRKTVHVANNTVIVQGPGVYFHDAKDSTIADNLLISETRFIKERGNTTGSIIYNNTECLGTEEECPGLLPPNPTCITRGLYCCEACESGPQPEYDNYCPNKVCCEACTLPLWLTQLSEPPEPVEGDLNNDGDVDVSDLIIVAKNFGLTAGYDSEADTDNNNVIDIFDVVFVASRFT